MRVATSALSSSAATPASNKTQQDATNFANNVNLSLERQIAQAAINGSPASGNRRGQRRMTHDMSALFAKAPWTVERQTSGNGGLKNAVYRARSEGIVDKVCWVGSLGMPTDTLTTATRQALETTLRNDYKCASVFVKDGTLEGHYHHYCKQILWPTLHYQIPDNPKSKAYEDHSWELYRAMNQAVADTVVKTYREGDTIWVNDYHLLLCPKMIREKLPNAKIGFFLHVAFPSSEVFRCLAAREQLLEGMLGADCIGFQIPEYARHFLQTCNRILAVDTTPYGVRMERKFVSVVVDAIGIDPDNLYRSKQEEAVAKWRELIRERWPTSKLIVGRDKLDNIRGVKQKLLAYERFLRTHPDMIEQAVLIQVCMTNKSEPELESDVTTIVDRINSLGTNLASSQPCVFLHKDIEFAQYIALLEEASAFAVTSVREGMNLTCHEFVYCNEYNSPLILSEFTGAASVLGPDTILVNPWDRMEMVDAFYTALTMDEDEKKRRWDTLYDLVIHNTCITWVKDFLHDVDLAWKEQQRRQLTSLPLLDMSQLREDYQNNMNAGYRMFFLDLDSTSAASNDYFSLSPYSARPNIQRASSTTSVFSSSSNASSTSLKTMFQNASGPTTGRLSVSSQGPFTSYHHGSHAESTEKERDKNNTTYMSPHRKLSMLYELVSDSKNIVYVVSSDSKLELERLFKHVPNVGLIAENGGFLKLYGSERWITLIDRESTREWQDILKPMMADVIERLSGAWLEFKGSAAYLHVSACEDKAWVNSYVGELVNHVNDAFASYDVHAVFTGSRVVISSDRYSKISAIKRAFQEDNSHLRAKLLSTAGMATETGYSCVDMIFIAAEGGEEGNDRIFEWANSLPNGLYGVDIHGGSIQAGDSTESLYYSNCTTPRNGANSDDERAPTPQSNHASEGGSTCSDSDRVDMFSGKQSIVKVPISYTVNVGGTGTYARFMVDGMNGLLNALLNAMRQKSSYE